MIDLAKRIEELEGPDREVDAEIALAVFDWCKPHKPDPEGPKFPLENKFGSPFFPRFFTGNLTDAKSLVDSRALWVVGSMEDGPFARLVWPQKDGGFSGGYIEAAAATPALALCAAAIRARESEGE